MRITDNRMYGFKKIGWMVTGGPCDKDVKKATVDARYGKGAPVDTGDFIFARNFVMGGFLGLGIQAWDKECTQLHSFQAAKVKTGIVSNVDTSKVYVRNVITADCEKGIHV